MPVARCTNGLNTQEASYDKKRLGANDAVCALLREQFRTVPSRAAIAVWENTQR
jgi:hypothetical protein